ncbi:hypothetical protein [uncultured Alistipes sp.]|uniref:hypothetical protein n=1 Tax=uncultured Alistipes sp. TaxID=538949 RepID=UPI002602182B|nr:hypothetical protein [uncultured Alistipes sp.]
MRTRAEIWRSLWLPGCLLASCLLASCREPDAADAANAADGALTRPVEVALSTEASPTRAFANDGTHRVDRIVAIPFRKTSESLPDDDRNYVPAYTLAVQRDVASFPVTGLVLHLPVGSTYKVLVIGYNRADYDYNDRSNPANRFDLGSLSSTATLADFHLYPKSPTAVPEFFTCLCTAYDGSAAVGTAFRPERNYRLSGALGRLVSGFSVTITGIPPFVKALSLVAENLTRASKATDGSVVLWQTTGDGGNRLIARKTPSAARSVVFDCYLLPTFETRPTRFFLDVEHGALTQRFVVKVPDSEVSADSRFILKPNRAINVSGGYAAIQLGFNLGFSVHLDDDAWDGLH